MLRRYLFLMCIFSLSLGAYELEYSVDCKSWSQQPRDSKSHFVRVDKSLVALIDESLRAYVNGFATGQESSWNSVTFVDDKNVISIGKNGSLTVSRLADNQSRKKKVFDELTRLVDVDQIVWISTLKPDGTSFLSNISPLMGSLVGIGSNIKVTCESTDGCFKEMRSETGDVSKYILSKDKALLAKLKEAGYFVEEDRQMLMFGCQRDRLKKFKEQSSVLLKKFEGKCTSKSQFNIPWEKIELHCQNIANSILPHFESLEKTSY